MDKLILTLTIVALQFSGAGSVSACTTDIDCLPNWFEKTCCSSLCKSGSCPVSNCTTDLDCSVNSIDHTCCDNKCQATGCCEVWCPDSCCHPDGTCDDIKTCLDLCSTNIPCPTKGYCCTELDVTGPAVAMYSEF